MPDPADFDSADAFMSACVPMMVDEGTPQDQAVAACSQVWEDKALPLQNRAYSVLEIKAIHTAKRIIDGIASTPTPNRLNDIVEPLGAKFSLPMPLLWQHRHHEPVGHVEFAKATNKGISFRARIAEIPEPGELKTLVDKAWQAVKAGLVRGVSIGFKPREHSMLDNGGIRFSAWDWYELSLVTIPANQEATISVIKSLDAEQMAASGQHVPAKRPGASGAKPVNLKLQGANGDEEYLGADRCSGIHASLQGRADEDVLGKSIEEGRSTDEAEQEEFDNLEREVERSMATSSGSGLWRRWLSARRSRSAHHDKSVEDGAAARGGSVKVTGQKAAAGYRVRAGGEVHRHRARQPR